MAGITQAISLVIAEGRFSRLTLTAVACLDLIQFFANCRSITS